MHRDVLKVGEGLVIDHVNRKGLDNRKGNLRGATHSENARNRGKLKRGGVSAYKGVCRCVGRKGWQARIKVDGKLLFLGYFREEVNAAKAYDAAAREYFGEFAGVNFPGVKRRFAWRGAAVRVWMWLRPA